MITLSLDIGGTRMKLALLEDGKILLERMVDAYRDDKYQKNLDTAEREGKAMMAELGIARIDGLGIAFPGLVNPRDKVVVSANGKFVDAVGYTHKSPIAEYQVPEEGFEETFTDWDAKEKGEYPFQMISLHCLRTVHSSFDNVPNIKEAAPNDLQINARDGDGEKTNGGEHAVASADVVGHDEFLVSLLIGEGLERAFVRVGRGVNALRGLFLAVLLLELFAEEAERDGGLGRRAGLRDDVDGEIVVADELCYLAQRVGGEAVAGKVDVGSALVGQVEIGGVKQLHHRAGAQIGAADADDHQGLGVAADALRRRLDAGKLLLVVVPGQVNPAGIRAA